MRRLAQMTAAIVATFGLFSALTPAQAQATRTWVSGVGDDANPCSRTAPCKTFAGAISKTASPGEIDCLDPAGYGTVTITKTITIDCHYTLGSVLASGVNGIVVSAGVNDVVTLRGIAINGAGTTLGVNGIRFLAGAKLIVDRVDIFGFSANGIDMNRSATGQLFVTNSSFSSLSVGINATTTAGTAQVSVNETKFYGASSAGVQLGTNANASINGSVFSGNAQAVLVNGAGSTADVSNSDITNNAVGLSIASTGKIRMSNNNLYDNATQLFNGSGTLLSAGNNRIDPSSAVGTTAIQIK